MPFKAKRVLVVVFDGARARFFRRAASGRLQVAMAEINSGLHHHTRDAVSDRPGRGFASAGGGVRHAYEGKHDEHKMEKHNFVQTIVKAVEQAFDGHAYDELVVVAPKRSLGEFRTLAPAKVKRAIVREVAKELAQLSESEIERHLAPFF